MDVFMRGVSFLATRDRVTQELARVLHNEPYTKYSDGGILLNFGVHLFPDKRGNHARQHSGCGVITFPIIAAAEHFLREFGTPIPSRWISVGNRTITFSPSNKSPRPDQVEFCRRMPYQDPVAKAEKEHQLAQLTHHVGLSAVQFGWYCRDGTFSLEWTRPYPHECELIFDQESRKLFVRGVEAPPSTVRQLSETDRPAVQIFMIRYSQIKDINTTDTTEKAIFFSLHVPCAFETEIGPADDLALYNQWRMWLAYPNMPRPDKPVRRRRSHFGDDHAVVAPYVSLAMRVICDSPGALSRFKEMARTAGLRFSEYDYTIARRGLYSSRMLTQLEDWLRRLPWLLAFHLESLHKKLLLDTQELLSLQPLVDRLVRARGHKYVAQLIRHYEVAAGQLAWEPTSNERTETAAQALLRVAKGYDPKQPQWMLDNAIGLFDCLHIIITPCSVIPAGQFPDRSNRVIRSYPKHQQHFVRVQFTDENELPTRFEREVDGAEFTNMRFGELMRTGLRIAGRRLEMLAYSQSALKEHAVWFMRSFDFEGRSVTAESIRQGLGTFDKVIYCPSLYGARMSQAFTATDPSVTIEPEELFTIPDIEGHDERGRLWQFTDGVGTISPELADDVCRALRAKKPRKRGKQLKPRAFQIRFAGSKGMVSVDCRARGRVLCTRPSMIKFESPQFFEIEIAQVFDKPGKFLLNRPMIMILEALGVPTSVFMKLQDDAVAEAYAAGQSLERAARLLETHGLGTSFRLTSLFLGLKKLGMETTSAASAFSSWDDSFLRRVISYGINHVLRELKHHARIPVPQSWTLVGIADIHSVLGEREVFVCVDAPYDSKRNYLKGPVVVTRSPAVAAGDIQILTAVGSPQPGSPYDRDPIANTIIFSTQGKRPIPSYLGGGDLDGDTFNVSQYKPLFPKTLYAPASYDSAPRKMLDRPSNIGDVIDHVVNFVNNDNLGVIAINFLIIADQSPEGIFQKECLQLSQLHSDAVDFQKSGQPVPMSKIPRLLFNAKPDWNAPETIKPGADYYQSTKAIGHLFRAISLPAVEDASTQAHSQRRASRRRRGETLEDLMDDLELDSVTDIEDPITVALSARVYDFIDENDDDEQRAITSLTKLFESYQSELQYICAMHSLSQSRRAVPLTEEEVIVGTIVAKTSVPRKRKELMAAMRDRSATLVSTVRSELVGDDHTPLADWLRKSWMAWRLSAGLLEQDDQVFGAKSFGLIAMGSTFDCVKEWEDNLNWEGSQRSHRSGRRSHLVRV